MIQFLRSCVLEGNESQDTKQSYNKCALFNGSLCTVNIFDVSYVTSVNDTEILGLFFLQRYAIMCTKKR